MKLLNKDSELVNVDSVKPHPLNPKKGDLKKLEESIEVNGFYGGIVVQKSTNFILAGNHRWVAAKSQGATQIPVFFVDVDDDHAKRIMIIDNRSSELGGYDDKKLADLLSEMNETQGLLGTGYTNEDLDTLLAETKSVNLEGSESRIEESEELAKQWGVKQGQIWVAGKHKLMCGDSLSQKDIQRLVGKDKIKMVFADPPYGIAIVKKAAGEEVGKVGKDGSIYAPIIGDETIGTAVKSVQMCLELFPKAAQIWWGGNYYANELPPSPCWLVWDKVQFANFADAELAWTNQKSAVRVFEHQWCGVVKASENNQKRVHPTQKPVALAEWCFEKYGKKGDIIFDPFAGSHMSAVAAENTGRSIRCIEMSPNYVAVGLKRLSDIGLKPELLED